MTAIAYTACALIWGTTWFAIRQCLQAYPPFLAIALRLSLAAALLMLGAFVLVPRPRWPGRSLFGLLAAGVFNATSFGCIYQAERTITGGLAAVLFGTMPLMTAALGAIAKTERLQWRSLPGALAALCGVMLIYSDAMGAARASGVLLALVAVLTSSIFTIIVKQSAANVHPVASSGLFLSSSAMMTWIFAIVAGQTTLPSPLAVGPSVAILYLALVGSVIVFLFYFTLLKRVSAFTSTTIVFIEPVIALAIDHVWEAQPLARMAYVGIALTLAGVALTLWLGSERSKGASTS